MKPPTNLDECKDLGMKEDGMTKLFKEQSNDANLREEEEGEEEKHITEGRDAVTRCSSEHKYLFGIPIDEQTIKFSTGPRVGSGKNNKRKFHKAGTKWIRM